MDTPSSKTGSYLVFAVAVVAVVALVLGILGLTRINKLSKQLGAVSVADLAVRVDTVEATAKKASEDSSRATTRVTGLSTDTQRAFDQVGSELATIRTSVNKLTTDTQAMSERLASAPSRAAAAAGSGAAPGTVAEDGSYVIKSGDTLSKIGAQFGVSWQEIQRLNPGLNPSRLQVGQKVVVPQKTP
jgi:LysM repeat protein